jgi:hypothetical protein
MMNPMGIEEKMQLIIQILNICRPHYFRTTT